MTKYLIYGDLNNNITTIDFYHQLGFGFANVNDEIQGYIDEEDLLFTFSLPSVILLEEEEI